MESSNLLPLASLDSLESAIGENEKPLMSQYAHMNHNLPQNGMYKMGSHPQKGIVDNSCHYKNQPSFNTFKNNLLTVSNNNLNLSKSKLEGHESYNLFHSNHENSENDENFLQSTIGSGGEISMEVNKKCLNFSPEQVLCMCEALQQKNDIDKLTTFLWSLPPEDMMMNNESIMRARAVVAYHRNSFHELYALLESHCFSVKFHPDLQALWYV